MPTGAAAQEAARKQTKTQSKDRADKGAGSLAGNITRDPELRYTENGKAVVSIGVAFAERVKNAKTGVWEDGDTAFYEIQAWGNLAENICQELQRGDRIVAEGRWQEQSWEDKQGSIQTKVVLVARDLGPSMMFKAASVKRVERQGG